MSEFREQNDREMQSNWGNGHSHLGWLALVAAGLTVLVVSSIFFGIEFTDSGFIQGISWAMYSGGTLYEDIDYVRPPLSPFFWQAVFFTGLTDGLEVLFRSLVTLEKGLTAFFVGSICLRYGLARNFAVFVGIITFVFLVHHLPAMPWHTVDGLFFVVLAVFLFSHQKVHLALISGLVAAGCKQSFYFFPPLLLLVILLDRRHRSAKSLILIMLTHTVVAFVFVSFLNVEAMLDTKGSDQSIDILIKVAVLPYFKIQWWHVPSILAALVAYLIFRPQGQLAVMILSIIHVPLASMAVVAVQVQRTDDLVFSIPPPGTTQLTFTFVAAVMLIAMFRNGLSRSIHEDKFQIAWLVLGGAWMSAISWGFNNHIFSFGLLLAAWALTTNEKTAMSHRIMASLIVFLCMSFVSMKLVTPYRTAGLWDSQNAMVPSGVYKFIFADTREHQRLATIERMFDHEGCVEIYPSAPQAHMIRARPTKLPAGWMLKVEYPRHEQTIDILAQHGCKLFIERDNNEIGWSAKNQLAAELNLDDVRHCLVTYDDHAWMVDFASCKVSGGSG